VDEKNKNKYKNPRGGKSINIMKILVVDDEEMIVEFLERSLRLDHNVVDIARNGTEAYEKASQQSYDVVILDIIMPGKNGLDVCHDLRELGVNTPVMLLSSKDGEVARIEGLDAGADDYMTKPFSYNELTARLRALMRRPLNLLPSIISLGDLSLDPVKKVISLEGKELELRPKEYSLLEYLMRNPGRVIPKDELLKNVWLISASNASNRLEVCMHHLREKININPDDTILSTIRGYGYVLKSLSDATTQPIQGAGLTV
jgi:DNA-binding response OmpR family regulator